MSDINEKKITSISDGANAMPVQWSLLAKNIRYNNAIIMATAIARKVDKQNLWNGLIVASDKVGTFEIKSYIPKMTALPIKETLSMAVQEGIQEKFEEKINSINITPFIPHFSIKGSIDAYLPIPTAERLPEGSTPIKAENMSTNTLYIDLRNPINLGVTTEEEIEEYEKINCKAFTIMVTVDNMTYYPIVTHFQLSKHNTIILTLDSDIMKDTKLPIAILYDSTKGTLMDSFNGGAVTNFQTTFVYIDKESAE